MPGAAGLVAAAAALVKIEASGLELEAALEEVEAGLDLGLGAAGGWEDNYEREAESVSKLRRQEHGRRERKLTSFLHFLVRLRNDGVRFSLGSGLLLLNWSCEERRRERGVKISSESRRRRGERRRDATHPRPRPRPHPHPKQEQLSPWAWMRAWPWWV